MAYKTYGVTSPPTMAEGVLGNVKGTGRSNHLLSSKYSSIFLFALVSYLFFFCGNSKILAFLGEGAGVEGRSF